MYSPLKAICSVDEEKKREKEKERKKKDNGKESELAVL